MTYGNLKLLVTGLLIGDNVLPKDDNVVKQLLEYSFSIVSDKAEALHLLTMNKNGEDIQRFATGEFLMRTPNMPTNDNEELDIDHELCFAIGRYVASMISKEKIKIHEEAAEKIILAYNGKVYQILETLTSKEEE